MERHEEPAGAPEDEVLRAMRVERVVRPDGRYLLYYDWPRIDDAAAVVEASAAAARDGDGE